jgi:hypothetical protein
MAHDPLAITMARVRLVSAGPWFPGSRAGRKVFRPLVVGPAILVRQPGAAGPWHVDVDGDLLLPACPPTERGILEVIRFHEAFGRTCRLAAALAVPADNGGLFLRRLSGPRRRCLDMFGWAILFQRPGMTGSAMVDGNESSGALPAFFECPLQLIDRSRFLTARGIPHRPLAIVVRPEDVGPEVPGPDAITSTWFQGRRRFGPEQDVPTPCSIADLLDLRR